MADKLKITLLKSGIGRQQKQKDILVALGLRRLNQSVIHSNTPIIRGMVKKVIHLLAVEEI
ncbi:MAG: 50S ribosomal protein L30 [Candidatus Alcyoniella australis]|nr:50S ribosomal protein L30 [Candidatus Alcyoniella australis]